MTPSRRNLAVGAAAALCAFVIATMAGSHAQEPEGNFGVGIPSVFLPKYLKFRAQQLNSGTPDVMRVRLGFVKGLSTTFTKAVGEAAINLQSGAFTVSLNGLTPLQTYTVSLLDQAEIETVPPLPDTVVGLVTFLASGPTRLLTGVLPLNLPPGFTIDRVAVVPATPPGTGPLASGSVNVFQKMFFRRLSLVNESTGVTLFQETTPAPALAALVPDLAAQTDALLSSVGSLQGPLTLGFAMASPHETSAQAAASGGSVSLDKLISKGAKLFFEETFHGNGRTCGTCHPANNNFTIDPPFIATLPPNDPLFVAEFNEALEDLEKPALMRSAGLILENVDGLDNPTVKFVMRGVPHTLGLQVSLTADLTQVPTPAEMTGWSGDGAPGTGSLRDFAIGAVTQHFTKRLVRVPGTDFKLPKEHELDAMEAFQLSLGRATDFNLTDIEFQLSTPNLNTGRDLFINGDTNPDAATNGTCNFCHRNGGALAVAPAGVNRNFNTNIEDRDHPQRNVGPNGLDPDFPFDGGFGRTDNGDGTFGNRMFNTASVVEAADTAPFFHNNVEGIVVGNDITQALEDAVRFYNGPEFNNPRPTGKFAFNDTEIDQIVAFLQGLNTIQNIDVARRELAEILALQGDPRKEQDTRLQTAFDETQDGIDVLGASGLYPTAKTRLEEAQALISHAQVTEPSARRPVIDQAIDKLDAAKALIATIAP